MKINPNIGGVYLKQSLTTQKTQINGVSLPDFNKFNMLTKTPPAMSEDEYREAIINMAKKDAVNGVYYDYNSPEHKALFKSFVSVVSPDREAIISNGLNALKPFLNSKDPLPSPFPSLIAFLTGNVDITQDGDKKTLRYATFYDETGKMIACYQKGYEHGEWSFFQSDAENARAAEFGKIYIDAYRAAFETDGRKLSDYTTDSITLRVIKRI